MSAFAYARVVARPRPGILHAVIAVLLVFAMVSVADAKTSPGKRVAMVIGNSGYVHAPKLANPANDATDIAIELKALGFTVVEGIDLTSRGMRDKIREFANELRGAEVGMLYYAGHGLQVNGRNYLAPIDAKLEFESDLDFETIPLEFVQRQMEREVQTVLLFLDACRDNPLTRSFRSASRSNGAGKGLAEIKSAAGTLIAFSTDPNNVALDGTGRNSPFTKALIDNISRKGVEVQTMMTDVRQEVYENTNEQQTPWINSSLLGRFYFSPQDGSDNSTSTGDPEKVASLDSSQSPGTRSSSALSSAQIESLAWDTVKDSKNPAELEAFISEYGNGFYGKLARLRLRSLNEAAAKQDKPAPAPKAEETQQVASLEQPKVAESRKLEPQLDPREVALGIQEELQRLSCNPGRPDGIWGRRSQGALDSFARSTKVRLVSADPSVDLLDQLKEYDGKGCPVAKTCPAGQRLSKRGNCFTPKQQASRSTGTQTRSSRNQPQVVEQPVAQQQQQVIIQQQQPVVVQQEPVFVEPQQQRVNPIGQILGGAITLGITCRLVGC